MKCTKLIILLVLIGLISFPLAGEKRMARTPMKELTCRNSLSYVPFPYPKNRREILADFKYYVQTYCAESIFDQINITDSPEIPGL